MSSAPESPATPGSLAEAEDHVWVDHAARLGLVAYGGVYLLVGWLALQLALGDREGSASTDGALHQLAQQPFGRVALWLVVVGMTLLVGWRLLETVAGHREKEGRARVGKRLVSALKAVLYAAIGVSAVQIALGSGGSGGGGSGGGSGGGNGGGQGGAESATAQLLALPAGQLLVGVVALAVIGYAAMQVRRGWTEGFREDLDAEGKSGHTGTAYVLAGKVGYLAKGLAVAIIGTLLGWAALTHDPQKSGGLDDALQQLLQQPFGRVLLALVAIGIGAYGAFCLARARHLSR